MTPEQITLVQTSFAQVKPIAAQAGSLFYAKLFEIAPELRPLFKGDIAEQGNKLMSMLGMAIGILNKPEQISAALLNLGKGHAAYGVTAEHFDPVGRALVATLREGLGDAFTPDVEAAWGALLAVVVSVMGEGLNQGRAANA